MKKLKLILPMLAIIMAIGFSFATVNLNLNKVEESGWIEGPTGWELVTVDCPTGQNKCQMYFSSNESQVYDVYNEPEGEILKTSNTSPVEIQD